MGVLQRLLLSRSDLPDAQNRPRPHPAVARLPALGPVANEPPGGGKNKKLTVSDVPRLSCSPECSTPCGFFITKQALEISWSVKSHYGSVHLSDFIKVGLTKRAKREKKKPPDIKLLNVSIPVQI